MSDLSCVWSASSAQLWFTSEDCSSDSPHCAANFWAPVWAKWWFQSSRAIRQMTWSIHSVSSSKLFGPSPRWKVHNGIPQIKSPGPKSEQISLFNFSLSHFLPPKRGVRTRRKRKQKKRERERERERKRPKTKPSEIHQIQEMNQEEAKNFPSLKLSLCNTSLFYTQGATLCVTAKI